MGYARKELAVKVAESVKVSQWFIQNRDSLLSMSRADIIRIIHKNFGVKVGPETVKEFEASVDIVRVPGNGTGARKDRSVVISRQLISLMKELGKEVPDDLADIASGK